jgi:hypothetical protein
MLEKCIRKALHQLKIDPFHQGLKSHVVNSDQVNIWSSRVQVILEFFGFKMKMND